jgi:hypothetical protein
MRPVCAMMSAEKGGILPVKFLSTAVAIASLVLCIGCETAPSTVSNPEQELEQDLTMTFGGFLQNGPQDELLDGQCSRNATRDVLQCDVHNGLMKWNISEITFQVIRTGDPENERHYYRQRVSIAPLQTETMVIKLGMRLPADTYLNMHNREVKTFTHWSWLIVGAKGRPAK